MVLEKNFKEAAEKVKNLKQRPTDNEMLELYGLYKQSLEGDVNTDAPSFINITAKSKWNAWNSRKAVKSIAISSPSASLHKSTSISFCGMSALLLGSFLFSTDSYRTWQGLLVGVSSPGRENTLLHTKTLVHDSLPTTNTYAITL
ncbi:unnamed protein product [Calicophoron daubneyi]|uniref:ACB domain-containing protein n=1 Tax=Calicophoron daubneyi TaxID=300641 RepID=A0AAV2TVP6_CALDB